jgi:hypothetical protein
LKQLLYSVEIKTREQLLDQITNRFNEIRQDDATIGRVYDSMAGVMLAFELKQDILNNFHRQSFSGIVIYFSSYPFLKVVL